MTETAAAIPIVRTKLHRPPVPGDYARRPRLQEALDSFRSRPLTLVSAAAGYGKSVLVSAWLEELNCRSAWVSLEESDSDLRQFLGYLVAAVQGVFTSALAQTQGLLGAANLPPVAVLTGTLINELDEFDEPLVLVLDDIHRIRERSVSDLLTQWLTYPPRNVHLVLVGRRDPFLPIARLRARGQVNEIRAQDLQFTVEETEAFLENVMGTGVDAGMAGAWTQGTEGWVTGLRLAALALRGDGAVSEDPFKPGKSRRHALKYLLREVLERQAPSVLNHLLRSAIADRFCAPLCDALRGRGGEEDAGGMQGQAFTDWLEEAGLFVIPLDEAHVWYRYHHLFQDLLRKEAERRFGGEGLAAAHRRAGAWFESQGLIEEAIRHGLKAGDVVWAAEILERYRHVEYDKDRWWNVERWLAMFPAEIREQQPKLLLVQAIYLHYRYQLREMVPIIERLELIVGDETTEPVDLGELKFLQGALRFWAGQPAISRQYLLEARQRIPQTHESFAGSVEVYLALASHMTGLRKPALEALSDRIRGGALLSSKFLALLVLAQSSVYLLSGELTQSAQSARALNRIAMRGGLAYMKTWGDYLEASSHFRAYDLETALPHFAPSIEHRYIMHMRAAIDAMVGLALTYQGMQRPDAATETVEKLLEFARGMQDPQHMSVARSGQARLALAQGDLEAAAQWLWSFDEKPIAPAMFVWLEVPSITQARVLVAMGSDETLRQAAELLATLRQATEALHNTCQTMEILALQCTTLKKQGRLDEALAVLKQTIALAESRGWVRSFVEAGLPMADLLRRLLTEGAGNADFIKNILTAIYERGIATETGELQSVRSSSTLGPRGTNPLTPRELEVLELLAQGLYQKEIAQRLFVSPETVKTHLKHIYRKLDVSNRRHAVNRGRTLNLLARH